MNCTDFEQAIQERLDARQDGLPPELDAHHAECAECRDYLANQRMLLSLMTVCAPARPPGRLIAAVLAELSTDTVLKSSGVSRAAAGGRFWGITCSAAALLLLTVTLLSSRNDVRETNARNDLAPSAANAAAANTQIVSETLSGLFQGMSAEYAGLPSESRRNLPVLRDLPTTTELLPHLPQTERPVPDASVDWKRWDRPVSDRVSQAFDFLWDALPQTTPQSS